MILAVKRQEKTITRMRYMMGCLIRIEVKDTEERTAKCALEKAFAEMKRIESLLSRFLPESAVSKINQQQVNRPIELPFEVFDLIAQSLRWSEICGGLFDITTAPLTHLWRACEARGTHPSRNEIMNTLEHVGSSHVVLDHKQHTLTFTKPGMQIDLGAVGKGYGVDRAIGVLRDSGIREAIVSTGSNIFCLGSQCNRFAIADPGDLNKPLTTLELRNNAVSTSANNERFFKIGNKCYGHLIHPKTGNCVDGLVQSVSVIGASAALTDILSTAIFLGGSRLAENMECWPIGYQAILAERQPFCKQLKIKRLGAVC